MEDIFRVGSDEIRFFLSSNKGSKVLSGIVDMKICENFGIGIPGYIAFAVKMILESKEKPRTEVRFKI